MKWNKITGEWLKTQLRMVSLENLLVLPPVSNVGDIVQVDGVYYVCEVEK